MLTVPEVCTRLGISKYTAYRLIHEGKIPAVRVDSGRHRFMVEEHEMDRMENQEDYFRVPVAEPAGPQLLTAAEVAQMMRCSVETVRRLAATGQLPAIRNQGRNSHWRFNQGDVMAYLRAQPVAAS